MVDREHFVESVGHRQSPGSVVTLLVLVELFLVDLLAIGCDVHGFVCVFVCVCIFYSSFVCVAWSYVLFPGGALVGAGGNVFKVIGLPF